MALKPSLIIITDIRGKMQELISGDSQVADAGNLMQRDPTVCDPKTTRKQGRLAVDLHGALD
jgi:hypothetical protein